MSACRSWCRLMVVASLAVSLQAQQTLVAPAAYTSADAIAYEWVAGASRPLRQQTLIGASHLATMLGRTITTIELRRNAANETYAGGTAHLTVTLSIAPHAPIEGSNAFAANIGTAAAQVFDGDVTLPTSPPPSTTTADWSADQVIRIELDTPYTYTGGTLCVDVVGQPIAGQNANWWMADAVFDDVPGSITNLGGGCGIYGGPQHEWAAIASRTLVPGGYARFFAFGPPNGLGLVVFGQRNPTPVPMWLLGLPSPQDCQLHLLTVDLLAPAIFEPENEPGLLSRGGVAEVRFKLPNLPQVLGLGMTTQWLEWSQFATSNAIEWSVATAPATLDMALLEGHPQSPTGELSVHLAQVMRFQFQ